MNDVKQSPIYYSGSKLRNIKNGMIDFFPKYINAFVDVFCGSSIVSLNTVAKEYILNDLNPNTIDLINMFKDYDFKELVIFYNELRQQLNFQDDKSISFYKKSKKYDEVAYNNHKKSYLQLKSLYNETKDVRYLYLLSIYSFCNQIRFNKKGDFNMSIGHNKFVPDINTRIELFNKFLSNNNISLLNKDFRELNYSNFIENDFLYFDPPYLITLATYNENGGWTEKDEIDLYTLLNNLSRKDIKWGLSNVTNHKGKVNYLLKDFMSNYNVRYENLQRSSLGKGNSNTTEIYVYNY